ncbi:hypothetical protein QVD17_17952 [Tagetes erecta]|uniref:Uncharacterized protein n=1 Tax=Tagetes erecta TaxID=13708 RepID=A0AAD8KK97_TARER|nr:hypothetical protein QVD17_17952 [Tagetes erecta]
MGKTTTNFPMSHRVLSPNHKYNTGDNSHDQLPVQLSGSIFGFLEQEVTAFSSPKNAVYEVRQEVENDDECEKPEDDDDKIKFWETQRESLHTTLFRTTSLESKIRNITKEAISEIEMNGNACSCSRPVFGGCRSCRMSEICIRLQNSGFDSAVCKSKWKSSFDIPSGEHTFLDVVDNSNRKKGDVRVIIELELRGQFEMKKASDEYNSLVCKLPDVFVGKSDRLQTVIKILSFAAKKCMKEKKMHLGPWRKQQYMQAKWLRVTERNTVATKVSPPLTMDDGFPRPTRVRTSMLTMDLVGDLPMVSCFYAQGVEVL